jgi:hypothetical protein
MPRSSGKLGLGLPRAGIDQELLHVLVAKNQGGAVASLDERKSFPVVTEDAVGIALEGVDRHGRRLCLPAAGLNEVHALSMLPAPRSLRCRATMAPLRARNRDARASEPGGNAGRSALPVGVGAERLRYSRNAATRKKGPQPSTSLRSAPDQPSNDRARDPRRSAGSPPGLLACPVRFANVRCADARTKPSEMRSPAGGRRLVIWRRWLSPRLVEGHLRQCVYAWDVGAGET